MVSGDSAANSFCSAACLCICALLVCQHHLISGCCDVRFIRAVVAETDREVGQQCGQFT